MIHTAGFNIGFLMRQLIGVATARGLQGRLIAAVTTLLVLIGPHAPAACGGRCWEWAACSAAAG